MVYVMKISHFQTIGVVLSLICFSSEPFVCQLCDAFNTNRIYIHDVFMTFCLIANVGVWRGLWNFLDIILGEWRK